MPEAWRTMRRAETRLRGACECVAGVDEAGRGPLAGPVVAAAVILDPTDDWAGLNDSKQMSARTRDALFARVLQRARAFRWAVVGARVIDTVNIRRASLTAMERAVTRLAITPDLVLVDGVDRIPGVTLPQQAVIDGDAKMLSIAAASVVAKVVRGGPAEKAGVKAGDVITSIESKGIQDSVAAMAVIAGLKPGQDVKFQLTRSERVIDLAINVAKRPRAPRSQRQ